MPFTAAILLIAPIAGRLSDKHGSRGLMTIGTLYAAGGMALLLRIEPDSAYESVILPAFLVLGSGMALTMAPMTAAVMGSVHPRHAGVASAATNTSRELGGVLGIALLGALVTDAFKTNLLDTLTSVGLNAGPARELVERAAGNAAAGGGTLEGFRQQLPPGTPDSVVAQIAAGAQGAFVDAIHSGLLVGVGFLILASLVSAIFVRSHVGKEFADEPEAATAPQAGKAPGPGSSQIDARTEQVLRQALERREAPDEPETLIPAEAEPELDEEQQEPAPALADAGAYAVKPPDDEEQGGPASSLETVEMPAAVQEEGDLHLRPAMRPRRKLGEVAPVSPTDTHYHPEQPAAVRSDGWAPEEETLDSTSAADSYYHLRQLMVELPIKAGTGEVETNLQEVALATLSYYQHGLSQPGGDALPVGVTNGAQSSIREDIGVLAGYLDLEKRFGRVDESVDSEHAASSMMAALASRALEGGGGSGNGEFVRQTVRTVLGVGAPVPAGAPDSGVEPSGGPARAPAGSDRKVYRRSTRGRRPER